MSEKFFGSFTIMVVSPVAVRVLCAPFKNLYGGLWVFMTWWALWIVDEMLIPTLWVIIRVIVEL